MLPLNSVGSCGMMASRVRSASMPIVVRSTPSISMVPLSASTRRKRHWRRVLLPYNIGEKKRREKKRREKERRRRREERR